MIETVFAQTTLPTLYIHIQKQTWGGWVLKPLKLLKVGNKVLALLAHLVPAYRASLFGGGDQ